MRAVNGILKYAACDPIKRIVRGTSRSGDSLESAGLGSDFNQRSELLTSKSQTRCARISYLLECLSPRFTLISTLRRVLLEGDV
jgi:hypothetical protein